MQDLLLKLGHCDWHVRVEIAVEPLTLRCHVFELDRAKRASWGWLLAQRFGCLCSPYVYRSEEPGSDDLHCFAGPQSQWCWMLFLCGEASCHLRVAAAARWVLHCSVLHPLEPIGATSACLQKTSRCWPSVSLPLAVSPSYSWYIIYLLCLNYAEKTGWPCLTCMQLLCVCCMCRCLFGHQLGRRTGMCRTAR